MLAVLHCLLGVIQLIWSHEHSKQTLKYTNVRSLSFAIKM